MMMRMMTTMMMMTMMMMIIIIQTEENQLPIADLVMSKRDAFSLNKGGHSDICQNMDGPQIRCRIE